MKPPKVTIDFETRSECDLKKAGAYLYSLHPTTMPTCLAFKVRGGKTWLVRFETINKPWKKLPQKLRDMWTRMIDNGYLFTAHNAFFETCIYKNILVKRYGWPDIHFRRFRCTAAKAAACALPRNLEGAGEAMRLSTQKDKRGYVAMMLTCKPTKQWNAWRKAVMAVKSGARVKAATIKKAKEPEPPKFLEYAHNPEVWETLYRYCIIDVEAEELLDDSLPDLIPDEQEIWFLNQRLNWRGFCVDIPTIKKIVGILIEENKAKLKELDTLTMGLVKSPHARQSVLDFLALEGIEVPDIRAKTVEDVLKGGKLNPDMKRLLEIRQQLSKASTKKYQAFLDRSGVDHRIRDTALYHGASTGRDAGTGINPYNFPRGVIKVSKDRPYAAVENVIKYDVECLRILYGERLDLVFSSILRNMIRASKGKELFVADFSKIEVAVLWWLADNKAGLKILLSGKDPYIYQAAKNLGKTYEEIETAVNAEEKWALDARQLGKAQILGCGFGMGWAKFKKTGFEQYRLTLTDKQSKEAVKNYREANETVPIYWEDVEQAAILAIERGKTVKVGRCKFFCKNDFLWIELPSGRRLAYREPRIAWRVREYEVEQIHPVTGKSVMVKKTTEPKKTIEFLGLDKSKKKLALERTWGGTLTENIVQATARDLMMPALLRLEKKGYEPLLSVYDEGVCEREKGKGSVEEFTKIMCERPEWADKYLPIEAKGWSGPRYRK